jgi:hypothetical protein
VSGQLDPEILRPLLEEAQVAAAILAAENPVWSDLWLRIDAALLVLHTPAEPTE